MYSDEIEEELFAFGFKSNLDFTVYKYYANVKTSADILMKDGFIVASTLQIYAADHCTRKCEFCTTSAPSRRVHTGDVKAFIKYINFLYDYNVKFNNINITGGEPFTNKSISSFICELRSGIKYGVRFVITTNGFWLDAAERFPSGLSEGDGIVISKYPEIVFGVGGLDRYQTLINRLNAVRPESIVTTESYFFRAWTFTSNPKHGYPVNCVLAINLSLSDSGILYKCCIAPGARYSPKMTPEFLALSHQLEVNLEENQDKEALRRWILSPLPSVCGFCTAHYPTEYYPVRDIRSSARLFDFSGGCNSEMLECGFSCSDPSGAWINSSSATMVFSGLPIAETDSPLVVCTFRIMYRMSLCVQKLSVLVELPGSEWKDNWEFNFEHRSFLEQNNFRVLFIPKALIRSKKFFRLKFSITEPNISLGIKYVIWES